MWLIQSGTGTAPIFRRERRPIAAPASLIFIISATPPGVLQGGPKSEPQSPRAWLVRQYPGTGYWPIWRNGKPPVPAEHVSDETIIGHSPKVATIETAATDARGLGADQKDGRERCALRLTGATGLPSAARLGPATEPRSFKTIR